jgi:hypothetical protein
VAATGIEHKLGIHGTPTCTMNFGDNDRCIGYIIGEENAGMKLMFHLMNEARLWVGMQGLALAGASYLQSLQYARERLQGSDVREFKNPNAPKAPIIRHPDVRRMLMTMKAHTEAMRSLFLTIAYMEDRMRTAATPEERQFYQGMVELFTPICKAYGSETGFAVTSVGVQVLGGYGYCCEFPHEQYMRDCRIAAIYEGANGIQAMDLFSRKVPMDKGRLFKAYIGEVDRFLADHKGKRPCIEDILTAVEKAKDLLVKTTLHLGKVAGADLALGLSQATPYLKMFGHVACAFELAKQAVLAHSRLDEIYAQRCVEQDEEKKKAEKRRLYETNADVNFYKSKIHTARFFAKNILPEADGLAAGMLSDDPSALEVLFGLEAE